VGLLIRIYFCTLKEKNMKRVGIAVVFTVFCIAAIAAQNYTDGFYFAQDADYVNNQKNQVVLEVKNGRIAAATWNILSLNAGTQDLKSIAGSGRVPAAANWASQAAVVEASLVSTQNVNTTSVSGGPANVQPFFNLVRKALSGTPIAKGLYTKDGWYYAEAPAVDDYHTKNSTLITVVNGSIVDILWNGILQGMPSSINPSKMITSRANGYPMPGARAAWHIQANAAVTALLQVQDPDKISLKANGTPDAISGVTIQLKDYLEAAKLALRSAK
jgi:major membrane immunogen (membrane-anchored lipoprotein)